MTDARQEDQDRIVGQPIEATQDGFCGGCGKRIIGKRDGVSGEQIVQRHGSWIHDEGTCLEELEARLAEADQGSAAA